MLLFLTGAVCGGLSAQSRPAAQGEEPILSLHECLQTGLERNFDLRIVRNEERIADNNATRGNAGQFPTLGLSGSYNGNLNGSGYQYPDSLVSTPSTYNANAAAALTADWTLFNGFSLQGQYARLQELKAKGELNTRIALEDFVAGLSAQYYNYIRQEIRLSHLKTSLELSRDRLFIVEASFNIGSASGLDYQQAQVDFNADHSAYIAQEEEVIRTRIQLNEMMALDDLETYYIPADRSIVADTTLERARVWQDVLENNVALQMAHHNRSLSKIDLKIARSRNYPYIKLNGSYNLRDNFYGDNAYSHMRQFGPSYGVTAGISLFDGMNRRREQQNAKIQLENSQLMLEQYENSLKADMANLWISYTNNLRLLQIERDNMVVAQSNFDIAMERYRLRELSGIELREAQLSLLESEERLLNAEYNIKLCEISLRQLSGRILEDCGTE